MSKNKFLKSLTILSFLTLLTLTSNSNNFVDAKHLKIQIDDSSNNSNLSPYTSDEYKPNPQQSNDNSTYSKEDETIINGEKKSSSSDSNHTSFDQSDVKPDDNISNPKDFKTYKTDDSSKTSEPSSSSSNESSSSSPKDDVEFKSTYKPIEKKDNFFEPTKILMWGGIIIGSLIVIYLLYIAITKASFKNMFSNVKNKLSKDVMETPYEDHLDTNTVKKESIQKQNSEVKTAPVVEASSIRAPKMDVSNKLEKQPQNTKPVKILQDKEDNVVNSKVSPEIEAIKKEIEMKNIQDFSKSDDIFDYDLNSSTTSASKSDFFERKNKSNVIKLDKKQNMNQSNYTEKLNKTVSNLDSIFDDFNDNSNSSENLSRLKRR